jgi:hypothetical protein
LEGEEWWKTKGKIVFFWISLILSNALARIEGPHSKCRYGDNKGWKCYAKNKG